MTGLVCRGATTAVRELTQNSAGSSRSMLGSRCPEYCRCEPKAYARDQHSQSTGEYRVQVRHAKGFEYQ